MRLETRLSSINGDAPLFFKKKGMPSSTEPALV
eukprot:SAG31_NODE_31136_length_370_cov_2.327206_1_plen_33_part_10